MTRAMFNNALRVITGRYKNDFEWSEEQFDLEPMLSPGGEARDEQEEEREDESDDEDESEPRKEAA